MDLVVIEISLAPSKTRKLFLLPILYFSNLYNYFPNAMQIYASFCMFDAFA